VPYANPPPANPPVPEVTDPVTVILIVADVAVRVKLVISEINHDCVISVLPVFIVRVDVPKLTALIEAPEEVNPRQFRAKLLVANVPEVTVIRFVQVKALPNVTLPVPRVIVIGAVNVAAEDVIVVVPVPLNVTIPVPFQEVVADNVILPATLKVPVDVSVHVAPVVVMLRQFNAPVRVIVGEPEAALMITLSAAVGTDAPAAPPDVADQFVVDEVFQVPVPPRQYLSAI
jgi:hypothetical protein